MLLTSRTPFPDVANSSKLKGYNNETQHHLHHKKINIKKLYTIKFQ